VKPEPLKLVLPDELSAAGGYKTEPLTPEALARAGAQATLERQADDMAANLAEGIYKQMVREVEQGIEQSLIALGLGNRLEDVQDKVTLKPLERHLPDGYAIAYAVELTNGTRHAFFQVKAVGVLGQQLGASVIRTDPIVKPGRFGK
jgi:hypothetical protein